MNGIRLRRQLRIKAEIEKASGLLSHRAVFRQSGPSASLVIERTQHAD